MGGGGESSRTSPKIFYLNDHEFKGSPSSMTPSKPQILDKSFIFLNVWNIVTVYPVLTQRQFFSWKIWLTIVF